MKRGTKQGTKPNIPSKRVTPRGIARSVAKHNLGDNAHRAIKRGHFATNWRMYATPKMK